MKISIINGPNLNLLGKRETDIYGGMSFETFYKKLETKFPDVELSFYQSNIEGELINEIQTKGFEVDAIIINPGGYGHTSIAIGDAIAAVPAPVIEVHISNVYAREEFRKLSHISAQSVGVITGLGLSGYELAVYHFMNQGSL